MNKELEAWNFIKDQMPNFTFSHLVEEMVENSHIVEQALQELQAIKNAKPSETMECFKRVWNDINGHNDYRQDFKDLKTIENYILKAQQQSIEEKMSIKDLVSKHIINHNSIVEIYEQEKDNSHYCKRIYRGMAWEMEKAEIGNRKLKYIFSALAEGKTDFDSDRICIEVEE